MSNRYKIFENQSKTLFQVMDTFDVVDGDCLGVCDCHDKDYAELICLALNLYNHNKEHILIREIYNYE